MQSVIFLDVDGVLNSIPPKRSVEPEKVHLLAKLVRATGAYLILHSGWRVWFDSHMHPLQEDAAKLTALLAEEGLVLSGMTPDLTTEEIRRTRKFSLVKADEILAWLKLHPQVQRWCVLDDLDLHNETIALRQIKPDSRIGLTLPAITSAISLLK